LVPDQAEEVFFTGGYHRTRRDGRWFPLAGSTGEDGRPSRERGVPPGLVRIPPGRYRNWHAEARREERHEDHERRASEKHEEHERHEGEHDDER
jgi:hypothetical protein